jgi:hypothetical protein
MALGTYGTYGAGLYGAGLYGGGGMTGIVGGLRARLVFDSTFKVLSDGLTALGWFAPGRRHQPVSLVDEPPDTDLEVPLNTLALSDENVTSADWELGGSSLVEKTRFLYVDLYAENDSLGKHLIGDVADLLEGRFPSIGRSAPVVAVYDYRQTSPSLITVCNVENLRVDRAHGWTRPWLRHWFSIQFQLVDVYQGDSG